MLFDGESHVSGPRAYTKCNLHVEESYVKYRFSHHFDDVESCVVWLAAWNYEAHLAENRNKHIALLA